MNNNELNNVKHYLDMLLGLSPVFSSWSPGVSLPLSFEDIYAFEKVTLADRDYLLISGVRKDSLPSSATVRRHFEVIHQRTGLRGILVASRMEAVQRRGLIAQRVPFIVPEQQLYLPDAGMDFRERRTGGSFPLAVLSPSAQLLLLAYLLKRIEGASFTASVLASVLECSSMTIGRSVAELEERGLLEVKRQGREHKIIFADAGVSLWERAKSHLRSPVSRRIFLEDDVGAVGPFAGLTALTGQTLLAEPKQRTLAFTTRQWAAFLQKTSVREVPNPWAADAEMEIQLWRYNPMLLTQGTTVDSLSLYLSFQNEHDARVSGACEQLLKEFLW